MSCARCSPVKNRCTRVDEENLTKSDPEGQMRPIKSSKETPGTGMFEVQPGCVEQPGLFCRHPSAAVPSPAVLNGLPGGHHPAG